VEEPQRTSDSLLELLIFGLGFSLIAWWTTVRARALVIAQHPTGHEMLGLAAYVLLLSAYLAFGPQAIDSGLPPAWIASPQIRFFVTLTKKLIVFVALPFALFGPLGGYRLRDFGWQKESFRELCRSHLPVVLCVSTGAPRLSIFPWRRCCASAGRQIHLSSASSRLAALFPLARNRSWTGRGILLSRAAPVATERVV
jgi:hypothetical protein